MAMQMRALLIALMWVTAFSANAAPELSEADRQRLAEGTSDQDGMLDEQDGLYVLLRNASQWQGDDFSGDAGAAVAPPPDYDYIKDNPAEVRGKTFLIEGWVAKHDRFPTQDNAGRDKLTRSGDPAWGDQVTRWTIATGKGDAGKTIIVLFNDPRAQVLNPGEKAKVKVAARFLKLWTIPSASGTPFTYPVFVGGAAETIEQPSSVGDDSSMRTLIVGLVLVGGVAFFVVRFMLAKRNGPSGSQLSLRLEEIRQHRERYEEESDEDDEADEDLPEDPIQALDTLRQRHQETD